jgi:hypothetical protein
MSEHDQGGTGDTPAQQPSGDAPAQQPPGDTPAQQPPGDTPAQQPYAYPPAQQPYAYPPAQQPYAYPPPPNPPPPNPWGGQQPPPYGSYPAATWSGQAGSVRGTGMSIFLFFITFGIYAYYWFYVVHDEMKRYKGDGLGGGLALVLYFFIGVASPFLSAMEVGELYERAGRPKPVSGLTGLWYFPGMFILVGPFVWFIKTNGALNAYWESVGAHWGEAPQR